MTLRTKANRETRGFIAKNKKSINLKTVNRLLVVLIIAAGVFYLIGVNDLSIKAYVLGERTKKLNRLKTVNNELELKAMSLSSYDNLSQKIADLKMVKVDKIDYLAGSAAVAVKR